MSSPIVIELDSNAAAILAALGRFTPAMQQSIARALDLENELSIGYMQANKLSLRSPTTLGVVSNRLRPSMRKSAAVVGETTVDSSIGTNVKYAAIHEFGFDGVVQVKQHKRRIIAYDRYEKRGSRFIQTQSGIKGIVKPHSMHMRMPQRSFIRTTIEERRSNYSQSISAAISSAWNAGGAS